ncbi:MAG: TRAP transporter large permease [Oscillospiraceae bacterium]|nr:TRAP transporter large permease [Oscillospiraceae bacterium]
MDALTIAIIGVIVLLILLMLSMNIGICMMAVGLFGCLAVYLSMGREAGQALTAALLTLKKIPFTQATNYTFVVIPLFVLMGQLCYYSGMSQGLYDMCEAFLGGCRGGLAMATIVACALFGAICGSSAATCATMAVVCLPQMRRHGYDDSLACGSVAAGGTLGILIPPSTGFIIFGIISGESIGALFAAGIIPGVILTLCFCGTVVVMCRVHPDWAPGKNKHSAKEKIASLRYGLPMVILFAIVIGGMFAGFFTATEGSAIGAFLSFLWLIISGNFKVKTFVAALRDTVKTSGQIFLILIGAYVFGNFLTVTNLPTQLAAWVQTLDVSRYIILFIILLLYAVMGCLMDSLAMVMLTVPIFFPIMTALGFNGIWYGVIMVMVMEMGLITPPVGMNVYIVSGQAKGVGLAKIFSGTFPMVIGMVVAILIICAFPQTATFLPSLLGYTV